MTNKPLQPINVPSIEALETAHPFPTQYTIKVIGPDSLEFRSNAKTCCHNHLGQGVDIGVTERQSKTGQHLALTLKFEVPSAKMVQEIYKELAQLQGLKFII